MRIINYKAFKLTVKEQEMLERFFRIYEQVITNNFVFNKQLISDAKEILNSIKEGQFYKTDLPSYQLAFLLSFGVRDTCLSVQKFYESLKGKKKIVKMLWKRNRIQLCCLEFESVPTVVGICQILDDIFGQYESTDSFDIREIRVSVVDKRQSWRWRRLCNYLVETVNPYFKNIELKLYFVNDFISGTSVMLTDKIKCSQLVVAAFHFKLSPYTRHWFLKDVEKEMMGNAIFFYFEPCCHKFYPNLWHLTSTANHFSGVLRFNFLYTSFEDLENKQHYSNLPINWNTDFQPVIFLTCKKDLQIAVNSQEKKNIQTTSPAVNQLVIPTEKIKVPKEKKKAKTSKKHRNLDLSDTTTTQVHSTKEEKKSHTPNIHDASNKQMNNSKTNKKPNSLQKSQPSCQKVPANQKVKLKTNNCLDLVEHSFPKAISINGIPKIIEFPNIQNKNKYKTLRLMEHELLVLKYFKPNTQAVKINKPNAKTVITSKIVLKLYPKSLQNKNKCASEENKPNIEIVQISEVGEELALTDALNEIECLERVNKPNTQEIKINKLPRKLNPRFSNEGSKNKYKKHRLLELEYEFIQHWLNDD